MTIFQEDGAVLCDDGFFRSASVKRNIETGRVRLVCPSKGFVTLLIIFEEDRINVRGVGVDSRDNSIDFKGSIVKG